MQDDDIHLPLGGTAAENQENEYHHDGRDKYQGKHVGPHGDAGGNRPEHVQQIHRILDGGTVPDNGQRPHHAQGQHHIGADGQGDHAGQHRHAHQGDGEGAVVHHAAEKAVVDKADHQAHQQGHPQGDHHLQYFLRCEGVLKHIQLQHRFFYQIFHTHGDFLLKSIVDGFRI